MWTGLNTRNCGALIFVVTLAQLSCWTTISDFRPCKDHMASLQWGRGPLIRYETCGLHMSWECRERFPRHQLQRKPLVSDLGMHHDTCVTHVSWCMSGSLTRSGRENVPGIPGACTTRNFCVSGKRPIWYKLNVQWVGTTNQKYYFLLATTKLIDWWWSLWIYVEVMIIQLPNLTDRWWLQGSPLQRFTHCDKSINENILGKFMNGVVTIILSVIASSADMW